MLHPSSVYASHLLPPSVLLYDWLQELSLTCDWHVICELISALSCIKDLFLNEFSDL